MPSKSKLFKSKTGRTLSKKVQAFIRHCAETGNAADAIRHAGFNTKDPENMGRQYRFRYRVQIEKAVTERIELEQPGALDVIVKLAKDSENDQVRLKAAQDILNRGNHLIGQRADQAKPEQSTADLIAEMVRIQGEQATALALERMDIPIPDYIAEQVRRAGLPRAEPATTGQGEHIPPVDEGEQEQAQGESLPN